MMIKNEHLIVLGYGDVGKRIVEVFIENDVHFTVVDKNEAAFSNVDFDHVSGDGTDEAVLMQAGIEKASTVIITLNTDTEVIFATLMARGLKPDCIIFSRANSVNSIDKLYKAGADYVASLSIVSGQLLAKITSKCTRPECYQLYEEIVLYEGIEIEKFQLKEGSSMVSNNIGELDFVNKFDCKIIGVERKGSVTVSLPSSFVLKVGDTIAVVGNREHVEKFRNIFIKQD
ncbi:Trk K+ transport system, NAD-binding component [Methanococcoides vulcani]|uniref:Trk K+ transport system, NAD-binding component n=1 Tax=Methanococcoides vulcani TaxID=1353158 RepID=A0A1I0BTI7_9EURY|nr:TrkA family potassium uptake protein [Methanococcoides vulcani]SET09684.1 Trk K+ transport system, NAD-binding component [Methanococcoides vulcani]